MKTKFFSMTNLHISSWVKHRRHSVINSWTTYSIFGRSRSGLLFISLLSREKRIFPQCLEMERQQRELIHRNLPDLVADVIPVDMLPYLSCLTSNDKEEIRCEEMNYGPMKATQKLVERLVRRPNAFHEFIRALTETGCEHLAELLYPQEEGKRRSV